VAPPFREKPFYEGAWDGRLSRAPLLYKNIVISVKNRDACFRKSRKLKPPQPHKTDPCERLTSSRVRAEQSRKRRAQRGIRNRVLIEARCPLSQFTSVIFHLSFMEGLSEANQVLWLHEDYASTRTVNVRYEKERDA
jgi:hypothetical protein